MTKIHCKDRECNYNKRGICHSDEITINDFVVIPYHGIVCEASNYEKVKEE